MRQDSSSNIKYQLYIDTSEILNKLLYRVLDLAISLGSDYNSYFGNRLSIFVKGYGTSYIYNIALMLYKYSQGNHTQIFEEDKVNTFNMSLKELFDPFIEDKQQLDLHIKHIENAVHQDLLNIFNGQFRGNFSQYDIIDLKMAYKNERILIFEVQRKNNSF